MRNVRFDIALSFAGEDRAYVDELAHILQGKGIKIFYDKFEQENLWGKDLYEFLNDVYSNQAFYTIMFISKHYVEKRWTNHERKAMQNRAFQENSEYVLPARLDESEIPGLNSTIGFVSLQDISPKEFAEMICKKLILGGRTIPSESVRNSLSPLVRVPQTKPKIVKLTTLDNHGNPISGVSVYFIADNNTHLSGTTNASGFVEMQINVRRNYTLFLAHANFSALQIDQIDPIEDLVFKLHPSENIGSIIMESTGYIPGLKGRLSPILDTSSRTYLYADNIAIDGDKPQPAGFKFNVPFDLEDCNGVIMQITILNIRGRTALVQYVKPLS